MGDIVGELTNAEEQKKTELVFDDGHIEAMAEYKTPEELCEKIEALSKKLRGKSAPEMREQLATVCQNLRCVITLSTTDRFFPLCYDKEATIFDYAKAVFDCENTSVREN